MGLEDRYYVDMTQPINIFKSLVMPRIKEAEYIDLTNWVMYCSPNIL